MSTPIRPYLEARTAAPSGWSPDDRRVLISSDLPGTEQVHRLDIAAAADVPVPAEDLVRITHLPEPTYATYIPDGDEPPFRLLVTSDHGGDERHQLYTATDSPTEAYGATDELDPLVVDRDHIHRPGAVSRDGRLLAYSTNRGNGVAFDSWVHDLCSGKERCVYATGGWTGPVRFSPDGRFLAVSEVTTKPADNRLHLVDLEVLGDPPTGPAGPAVVEIAAHDRASSVGTPAWLPDGGGFFFATDVHRDRTGIARGTPDGAWEYVLEPDWDVDCAVDEAGRHLLVVINEDGIARAELRDPVTLQMTAEIPLPGAGVASEFRFSRDGRYLTFAYSSPIVPGDTWRYDTSSAELHRITVSPCLVDAASFVDAERVRFTSFDGLEVPAFVLRPRGDVGPNPVVVRIHGGPESQWRPSYDPVVQYLVAQGFAVIAPNVRGSTGYGRAYTHLDDVELRPDSVRDLAGLHDWIAAQPDLDEDRAALYGGSYGGYMVLAGLAFQPERWAAGVDIVGISNLVTFLENTSAWRRAFREREYGSLEHDRDLLQAISPITHVDDMRAPLFMIHGANDPRVPLSETQQIHRVLTDRGVRTELLVYDDEGHGLSKLVNRIDAYTAVTDFLREVLAP